MACPSGRSGLIRTIIRSATYVEEAVEDDVAEAGISDDNARRGLAGEESAAPGAAVVEDLRAGRDAPVARVKRGPSRRG